MRARVDGWFAAIWDKTYRQLPGWFVLPGFMRQWSRSLRIEALPPIVDDFAQGDVLDIELEPNLLLRKQLVVPLAAKASLSQAVDLNMRQSLPGGGTDLIWRYAIEGREKSGLRLGIYVIKKTALEQIAEAVRLKKGIIRTISVANVTTVKPLVDSRRNVDKTRQFWDAATIALLVLSVGLVSLQGLQHGAELQQQIAQLEQQKLDLNQSTIDLRRQLDAETSSYAAIRRDVKLFISEHQRLPIILDLTEALDEKTWASEVVISGSRLMLSGFTSHEVADVMDAIRPLPWVARVDLEGPVTFDTFSRKNRFDLSIMLQPIREAYN